MRYKWGGRSRADLDFLQVFWLWPTVLRQWVPVKEAEQKGKEIGAKTRRVGKSEHFTIHALTSRVQEFSK